MGVDNEEPEGQLPPRTTPPAKKPLADFLAEFERRLAAEPDAPATDAHLELAARAEGARHRVRPQQPEDTAAVEGEPPGAAEEAAATEGPVLAPGALTPPESPAPGAAETEPVSTDPVGAIRRRMRSRRHRRRRH
jgi:hypothetical protein